MAGFAYRTDLFAPATIARLAMYYHRLLDAAVAEPDRALSRLPLLDARERHEVVVEWNRTTHPYPTDASRPHARRAPGRARPEERVAMVAGERTLTYGDLDGRAEALAARLRAAGVRPGSVVGVGDGALAGGDRGLSRRVEGGRRVPAARAGTTRRSAWP